MSTQTFTANGRTYTLPSSPLVVICIDGSVHNYDAFYVATPLVAQQEQEAASRVVV